MLLGIEVDGVLQKINDDTIEGATVLLNRIGSIIDDKIEKLKKESLAKPEKEAKNTDTINKFNTVYQKIEEIANNSEGKPEYAEISLRVKILCKNMLDDQKNNWERQRQINEKGPKKVEDLRRELEQKAYEEEKQRQFESDQQYYGERDRYYEGGSGGGRGGRQQKSSTAYVKKNTSSHDQQQYDEGQSQKGGRRERTSVKQTSSTKDAQYKPKGGAAPT